MRRAKTHFEQIPVEVVKKIAEQEFPETKDGDVILKIPAKKPEPHTLRFRLRCRHAI